MQNRRVGEVLADGFLVKAKIGVATKRAIILVIPKEAKRAFRLRFFLKPDVDEAVTVIFEDHLGALPSFMGCFFLVLLYICFPKVRSLDEFRNLVRLHEIQHHVLHAGDQALADAVQLPLSSQLFRHQ